MFVPPLDRTAHRWNCFYEGENMARHHPILTNAFVVL
jgi:hypothetical protein